MIGKTNFIGCSGDISSAAFFIVAALITPGSDVTIHNIGKWLQQTPLLKNREKEWKKRVPRFDIDVNETYQIFQTYAPQIW